MTGSWDDEHVVVELDAPTCPTCRAVWPDLLICPDDGGALEPRPFLTTRPSPRSLD